MKNIILLIISSNDVNVYNDFKILSRLYHKKMKDIYKDNYNYFFVELKDMPNDIEIQEDTIYIKGTESIIPGIFYKTTKAMNYIANNYDFDLLIRTNLSSFWNIPYVFNYFENYSTTNLVTGVACSNFITGTGIILSKNVVEKISLIEDNSHIHDDVLLSNYLNVMYETQRLPSNLMYYLVDGENNVFPTDINNIMYYRIKSQGGRYYDISAFKKLLEMIYNINTF
jgi:hypothetical protein